MTYTAEDFTFSSATEFEEAHLDCPYAGCWWEFEIRPHFDCLSDLLEEASKHLEEKHGD